MNKSLARTVFRFLHTRGPTSSDWPGSTVLGQLQLDEMITRRYRLDDINDAYDDLRNGEIIRGIIDFRIE